MRRPAYDAKQMAQILADAKLLGDQKAAKKWNIGARTIRRYRATAIHDPKVTALVAEEVKVRTDGLRDDTIETVKVLQKRMRELAATADSHACAEMLKAVNEGRIASDVLSNEPGRDSAGQESSRTPSSATADREGAGSEDAGDLPH